MRKLLTPYLYYTRGERNGIIILVTLAFSIMLISKILPLKNYEEEKYDFSSFEKEILAFNSFEPYNDGESFENTEGGNSEATLFRFDPNTASSGEFMRLGLSPKVATIIQHYRDKGGRFFKKEDLTKIYGLTTADYHRLEKFIEIKGDNLSYINKDRGEKTLYQTTQNIAQKPVKLFPFDPNAATEESLLSLGIDEKVVKNLLKFREKNGKFYKKEDLKKIYGFSEIDYLRLESYIQITDKQRFEADNRRTEYTHIERKNIINPIDINTATFDDYLQIRGIGRTFATRILEQREKLGGFASVEQIKEIHGLPDTTYQNIIPYLKVSTNIYRKISINKTTQNFAHPYLSRRQMEAMERYRMNHGNFNTVEDLKKVGVFNDANLIKLIPYISFD